MAKGDLELALRAVERQAAAMQEIERKIAELYKRRSSGLPATAPPNADHERNINRGGSHPPRGVEAEMPSHAPNGATRTVQRVLALRAALDWSNAEHRELYRELRDLGWQAAHYRNMMLRAKWAQAYGWTSPSAPDDKAGPSKDVRQREKGDLSGDAYSAAEMEVQGVWTREGKRILAGAPLPEWRPDAALSVTGKARREDSGVQLVKHGDEYVVRLRARSNKDPRGSWIEIPIKRGSARDEWQGPILDKMLRWEIPMKKATVHVERRGITVRITYPLTLPPLPPPGERRAVISITQDGRFLVRTETQTKCFTDRYQYLLRRSDDWDLIRRRVLAQCGRRKGHARRKREAIARLGWHDWLRDYLHRWTADIVQWCRSQLVGTIEIAEIGALTWPAAQFRQLLGYKAEEHGISVATSADVTAEPGERAAEAELRRRSARAKKRREALREISYQLTEVENGKPER
jgi:transposase